MPRPTPNFVILDGSLPDVGRPVGAMLRAREAIESRSWLHPQEPTTEEWWATCSPIPAHKFGNAAAASRQSLSRGGASDYRFPLPSCRADRRTS
jgi:hypothetical protein